MQSNSRSSYVSHHNTKVSETRRFIESLGTWALALALAVGAIIVMLWVVAGT
jgi:hypothetical protein